jgi:threonylcarbamoyladenosine tRNA methylthiotransferase MtaB
MAVEIVTFGCRLNAYESEVMRGEAEKAGLGRLSGGAIVFNTCAVTGEAVRQARQAIRKARRENPEARIVVTGCAAQTETGTFTEMEEVNDIMSVTETAGHMVDAIEGRARAFVQVQNGCDHRCTFCIIPFGRGNSRSVPMGVVVDQVRTLVEATATGRWC